MIVYELTSAQCHDVLSTASIGRLGCALNGQPYIVPISLYFDREAKCLYSFSTVGTKIQWMRQNPSVCVEVDDIANQFDWTTVLVTGRYEELDDSDQGKSERQRALELFQAHPQWWLPVTAKLASGLEHDAPVIYRIHIISVTGRRARRPN